MLQCHIFLTNHTSMVQWLLHLWGLMASQGFWDPCISVCFATHYIFWWAVLKGLASHPIHPPLPPVCSWRSCQDGYDGTVCGMFSVADILHIGDVICRVVLMYSCCTCILCWEAVIWLFLLHEMYEMFRYFILLYQTNPTSSPGLLGCHVFCLWLPYCYTTDVIFWILEMSSKFGQQ